MCFSLLDYHYLICIYKYLFAQMIKVKTQDSVSAFLGSNLFLFAE